MRVFTGGIATETNTFSPIPIGFGAFQRQRLRRRDDPVDDSSKMGTLQTAIYQSQLLKNAEVIYGLDAMAQPGAAVVKNVFESLRDELLEDLAQSLPVDAVLLNLHGGMVADGYDDPEGDLLVRVRELVGDSVFVGVLLDPHCHVTPDMTCSSTALVCYKENPHTDGMSRADDLISMCFEAVAGRINPRMLVGECGMIDAFQTDREPMRSLIERIRQWEREPEIIDISIVHGFRRADIPILGSKVIVVSDGEQPRANELAAAIVRELKTMRGRASRQVTPVDEAITDALAAGDTPVILADASDNPGGGAPGDSTYVLHELFRAGCRNIAAGYLWDPVATTLAFEAGINATLTMRIGGKACALSGPPLDLTVTVKGLLEHTEQTYFGFSMPMGRCARLRGDGGLELIVSESRIQAYVPTVFDQLGVDLAAKQVIVVKSGQHYRAGFRDRIAGDIVIDAPGVCCNDVTSLPFTRAPTDIWPFNQRAGSSERDGIAPRGCGAQV